MTMNERAVEPRFEVSDGQAALFHALAEPTRLALLRHLSTGEHRVRDLVEHTHLAQSTVSKHLACLRDCGLVTWVALTDPARLAAVLAAADAHLSASGVILSLEDHRDHGAPDHHQEGEP